MSRPNMVRQATDRLLRMIATMSRANGASLPSSRAIASELGVSQRVAMEAMRRLADQGLLAIRPRRPAILLPGASARAGHVLRCADLNRSTPRVIVLMSDVEMPQHWRRFYAGFCGLVLQELRRVGVEGRTRSWVLEHRLAMARSLLRAPCDGAVFVGFDRAYLDAICLLHEHRFPLVVFDRKLRELTVPTVTVDDYAAGRDIADHLIRMGHRNLCLVTDAHHIAEGYADPHHFGGRVYGWMDSLHAHNLLGECSLPTHIPWSVRMPTYDHVFARVRGTPYRTSA